MVVVKSPPSPCVKEEGDWDTFSIDVAVVLIVVIVVSDAAAVVIFGIVSSTVVAGSLVVLDV